MKPAVLVDSDILIDFSRRRSEAIELLRRLESEYSVLISDISRMELMVGARDKRELAIVTTSLNRYGRLPLTEVISSRAVELIHAYRLSHGLMIADALIAASALSWDAGLVTKNRRDFRYIENLRLFDQEST